MCALAATFYIPPAGFNRAGGKQARMRTNMLVWVCVCSTSAALVPFERWQRQHIDREMFPTKYGDGRDAATL